MKIKIDGKMVTARKGETILTAARRAGIDIPSLCHHEAIEASGACRICMVEVTKAQWNGWSKLVTSCLFPVEEDLIVSTDSPEVHQTRKEVLDLLLARAPESTVIQDLAEEYGVESTSFQPREEGGDLANCILCGVCTRVCQELVTGAITTSGRGIEKKVGTLFDEPSDQCIGCLACAGSCPTHAIPVKDTGRTRTIWGRTFDLVPCRECGAPTTTPEQIRWLSERTGRPEDDFKVCTACKTRATGEAYARISW